MLGKEEGESIRFVCSACQIEWESGMNVPGSGCHTTFTRGRLGREECADHPIRKRVDPLLVLALDETYRHIFAHLTNCPERAKELSMPLSAEGTALERHLVTG